MEAQPITLNLTGEERRHATKALVAGIKVWERHSAEPGMTTPETAILRELVSRMIHGGD